MAHVHRARWVLPIARRPIDDGWVAVDAGRIVAVGAASDPPPPGYSVARSRDHSDVAILPALVNAHTHLELSYLHGRVPPRERFSEWIRDLIATRRQYPAAPEILTAARDAIASARASGTGLFGDISNTLVTVPLLREAGLAAQVFYELLGFAVADPRGLVAAAAAKAEALDDGGSVRVSLAPHAPYSVSPPLFAAIREALDARPNAVSSVHLGESPDEVEFIRDGTGDIRSTLERLGVWTDEWRGVLPAATSPVSYLSKIGFLTASVLVVHGVQFDAGDLDRLRALGATIASCPRSNKHVGAGSPPLEAFYASGVRVAFGTDSLASVADLNLFAELAEARRIAPSVPARKLLESATKVGAEALGFGTEFGTIEAGKAAKLVAVRLPPDVTDVEEYLVSGRGVEAVTWVGE